MTTYQETIQTVGTILGQHAQGPAAFLTAVAVAEGYNRATAAELRRIEERSPRAWRTFRGRVERFAADYRSLA